MMVELDKEKQKKFQADFSFVQNLKSQVKDCEGKIEKTLEAPSFL